MKRLLSIFVLFLVLIAPVYAYIVITVSDPQIELMPGDSAGLTATINSNEEYDVAILCDIDKYDSSDTYIETVSNEATGCDGGSGVTVEFSDGTRIHGGQSGDTMHDYIVALDGGVDPGYEYRYTIGARNSYSVGAVTADVNTIPEFSAITAGIALGGAGLAFWRLRRRK